MICLNCLNIVVVFIFADDTTIYHTGTNQTEVYRKMNSDLETLSDWFKANKLSVNSSKTKYMVFKCKRSVEAQTTQPDLYIDNEVLEKVPVTKFLGVYIDENLDWIEHIDFVKKKISGGIYTLNSSKIFCQMQTCELCTIVLYIHTCYMALFYGAEIHTQIVCITEKVPASDV